MTSDAEAAGALARELVTKRADTDAIRGAGVLDADLPRDARVEVGVELGRGGLAKALELLAPASDLDTAAALCGAAYALVDIGIAYAKDRHVFGKPLAAFQVQRHNFALAAARTEAATSLVRRVAAQEEPDAVDAAAALPAAIDAAWLAAETALQVHGGYGYSDEYPVSIMWQEVVAVRSKHPGPTEAAISAG